MNDILRCRKTIEFFATTEKKFRYVFQQFAVIQELVDILKHLYDTTQAIQVQKYTLSDFYASWVRMKLQLQKAMQNESRFRLAFHLYEALKAREASLLNQGMLCAIYLDGRFPNELSADQLALVKLTLVKLWEKVCALTSEESDEVHNISDDILERYLKSKDAEMVRNYSSMNSTGGASMLERGHTSVNEPPPNFRMNGNLLLLTLAEYEKNGRPNAKISSLETWEERKRQFPEIYILASIIHGIPPSQASVERAFSALSLVVNSKRYNLTQHVLEDILSIKLNQNMLDPIFEKDVDDTLNDENTENQTDVEDNHSVL